MSFCSASRRQFKTGTPAAGSAAGLLRPSEAPAVSSGTNLTANSSGDRVGRSSLCVVANALIALNHRLTLTALHRLSLASVFVELFC